jgi:hypothetical protein
LEGQRVPLIQCGLVLPEPPHGLGNGTGGTAAERLEHTGDGRVRARPCERAVRQNEAGLGL